MAFVFIKCRFFKSSSNTSTSFHHPVFGLPFDSTCFI